jgi:hypothetical protein
LPPSSFFQARHNLIVKIKELKIPVQVPLLVVEEQEESDEDSHTSPSKLKPDLK